MTTDPRVEALDRSGTDAEGRQWVCGAPPPPDAGGNMFGPFGPCQWQPGHEGRIADHRHPPARLVGCAPPPRTPLDDPRVPLLEADNDGQGATYAAYTLDELDAVDPLRLALTNPSDELIRLIADAEARAYNLAPDTLPIVHLRASMARAALAALAAEFGVTG